jgi:hypothetical protein
MQRAPYSELIFPIKDAASAALMLIKADCLHTARIINEAEKQYVRSRARTFLSRATLQDAVFLNNSQCPPAFKTVLAMATRAGQYTRTGLPRRHAALHQA